MKKNIILKIKLIPPKPGVYLFKDRIGRILYIGKAVNLKNRISSHFKKDSSLIGQFRQKIAAIDYVKTENEAQALILEDQLIKKHQPKFNIQQRDDKSYFWVAISDDEWPRVRVVHRLKKSAEKSKSDFIGPFTNGTELKRTLRTLRKILPYRTCKNSYEKPCLQWHLGLCPAHRSFAQQDKGGPAHKTDSKFQTQGSRLKNNYLASLNTLKQLLRLYAGDSLRTEAYDISNIQGANATGSMIVFTGNKPKKSGYRKFRIKTVHGANDIAMLKEVIRRRLYHREWPLPDLILIDGGRAQLNSLALEIGSPRWSASEAGHWKLPARYSPEAKPMAGGEIPLVSLAKRDEELYTIYSNKILSLSTLPTGLRLVLQAIRNEAHRFAISYYRRLHQKKLNLNKSKMASPNTEIIQNQAEAKARRREKKKKVKMVLSGKSVLSLQRIIKKRFHL